MAVNVLVDAVGQPTACVQADAAALSFCWGPDTGGINIFTAPVYSLDGSTVRLGIGVQLLHDHTTSVTSMPIAGVVTGGNAEADQAADGADQCDNGECCFRQHSANAPYDTAQTDTPTGGGHNGNGGNIYDYPPDIMLSGGYTGPTAIEVFGEVDAEGRGGHADGKARIEWEEGRERERRAYESTPALRHAGANTTTCPASNDDGKGSFASGVGNVLGGVAKDIAIRVAIVVVLGPLGLPVIMVRDIITIVETGSDAAEGAEQLAENPEQVAKDAAQTLENPEARGEAAATVVVVIIGVKGLGIGKGKGGTGGKAGSSAADTAANGKRTGVHKNKTQGDVFEQAEKAALEAKGKIVATQVTVKVKDGTRTRLDIVDKDPGSTGINLTECKSSEAARLTKNQRKAFPQIETSGGIIVGKGKPGFPGGTVLPPTKVRVSRPGAHHGD